MNQQPLLLNAQNQEQIMMLNQNNEYTSGQQTPRQRNEDGDA